MTIKKRWVVRATWNLGNEPQWYQSYEEFKTREKARVYSRLLKEMGNWKDVKIFRAVEAEFDDGVVSIYMEPVR